MQIAIYARVSTTRQAENDLSIPDQLRQLHEWAERQGHVVVREYVEPGASATDDKRPVFQEMMLAAEQKPAPFQLIIVHSLSRFFRDLAQAVMYERKLLKLGIKVVSITQVTNDDPSGAMLRHMVMMFDEYQSKENAKHTLRGMQENARQGYYNGSVAPYGYETVAAGKAGFRGRQKKKLAIHQAEAETVKLIYQLYVTGVDGPRIGIKEIAKYLNAKGMLMRGKEWRLQKIYDILSSTTYSGWHVFNKREAKTWQRKDESQWIKSAIPAIVDGSLYERAKQLRNANSLKNSVPSRENSPTLLTGILKCDHCGFIPLAISRALCGN